MHDILACVRLGKRAQSDGVGDAHIKRQASVKLDLLIEKGNRLGGRKPQLLKDVLDFVLEVGVNPRSNHGWFVHGHLRSGR